MYLHVYSVWAACKCMYVMYVLIKGLSCLDGTRHINKGGVFINICNRLL